MTLSHCTCVSADGTQQTGPEHHPGCPLRGATLPTDSKARKDIPLVRGCLDYFPAALAAVAELSRKGNDKHNPGEPLHHARGKSTDHADCIVRHLMDRGTIDPEDGVRHSAKVAWRALALLQEELEVAGAPLARGARLPGPARVSKLLDELLARPAPKMSRREYRRRVRLQLQSLVEWAPELARDWARRNRVRLPSGKTGGVRARTPPGG